MLSRAIDLEVSWGHAKRETLAGRVSALEAQVVELEEEHTTLRGDVSTLRGARKVLE